jgi:putative N6-adenine-specific DNA methylase
MSPTLSLAAVTAFGLEAVVSRELTDLGMQDLVVEDGRVWFRGDERAIARANIQLRSAERVLVCVGRFEARDFGELFDQTRNLPWERWLGADAAFPVDGRSVRSQLHSTPDCQRIVKKAIAERLKDVHSLEWCPESGTEYQLEVALVDDQAILTIDTSGDGLHKRGYRKDGGTAPLRETTAAGLVQLSYWRLGRPFLDACCGSGTIAIEAAMWGRRIAPGLNRTFAAESWSQISASIWEDARSEARSQILPAGSVQLQAGDIDPAVVAQAAQNARTAGVSDDIEFSVCDAGEWSSLPDYGCLITNPPYGERLGSQTEVESLYRTLGRLSRDLGTWSLYVLTAHPTFESLFGRRADRRRKLYNAKLACTYFQYFGPRPPRDAGAP